MSLVHPHWFIGVLRRGHARLDDMGPFGSMSGTD